MGDADLPLVFVSDTRGAAAAVSAMRMGARDYILKNQLERLAPAVERELNEAGARRELGQTRPQRAADTCLAHLFRYVHSLANDLLPVVLLSPRGPLV